MDIVTQATNDTQLSSTQSLTRAFAILEMLSDHPNGCQLQLIAQATGLNKSTVYRLLKSMQKLGYVSNGTIAGSYRLSFKLVGLGQKIINEQNVVQLALPELNKLNELTGETVNLKFFQGDHSVILFKLEPNIGNFRTRTYMGQSVPLYSSATGKIFLAYRSEEFVRHYWQSNAVNITRITPSTVVDIEVLLERLKAVRRNGYALDLEENEIGISCIAAPVFDYEKKVNYAVSIAMQTSKLQINSLEAYSIPLCQTVENISKSLGYFDPISPITAKEE